MTLEKEVGRLLTAGKKTLAVAESCTGGLLGEMITRVPGSSNYFWGGWLTYNRAAKRQLGVGQKLLARWGEVSAECAGAMAKNARRRAGTDYALAITGIAGPGGGGPKKPVGLVYIALAGMGGRRVWKKRFSGSRRTVRSRSARTGLEFLRRELQRPSFASRTSPAS